MLSIFASRLARRRCFITIEVLTISRSGLTRLRLKQSPSECPLDTNTQHCLIQNSLALKHWNPSTSSAANPAERECKSWDRSRCHHNTPLNPECDIHGGA